ncbi:MAG: hypothetical protein ACRCX2_03860 [Paraclostridium sp.]
MARTEKEGKIYNKENVKFVGLRLTVDLHRELKIELLKRDISFQDYLVGLILKDGMVKIDEEKHI